MGAGARLPVGCVSCRFAAQGGHHESLQWARENGLPWNANDCARVAVAAGRAEVAQWVRAQVGLVDAKSPGPGLLNVVAGFLLVDVVILVRETRRA